MRIKILTGILVLGMVFTIVFGATTNSTKAANVSGLVEFQTIDIGSPWVGVQLQSNQAPKIPGRRIQPDRLSLTYVTKPSGYTGRILRGTLVYNMGGDIYYGYGAGWGQIGPASMILGNMKAGMNVSLIGRLRARGEFLIYFPIWDLGEDNEQEAFFGLNLGLGF